MWSLCQSEALSCLIGIFDYFMTWNIDEIIYKCVIMIWTLKQMVSDTVIEDIRRDAAKGGEARITLRAQNQGPSQP